MQKQPRIQVDYTTNRKNFQLVFSTNFELNIPADDSVRLLSNVLEELDYNEAVKPLIEVNNKIIELQKQGKENTSEYLELKLKKADIMQNVITEINKNKVERNKYSKLTSDLNSLKQQYPHATDEQIKKLSMLIEANERTWHNKKYANDFFKHEVFTTYLQQNEEIHRLVDEMSFEERKHKYKNFSFASIEDSAAVSDYDIELFDKLSKMFGTKYVFDSTLQYDGEYNNGTIFINPNAKSIHQNVYAHELVHYGEHSPQYEEFKKAIFEGGRLSAWASSKGYSFDQLKSAYTEAYKQAYGASSENSTTLIENEIVADYVADILTQDISYLNRMAQQDTGFRKVLSYIRDFFAKIADKLHLSNSDARYERNLVERFTKVLNTVDSLKVNENAETFAKNKIDISFKNEYQQWIKDGRPDRKTLTVGRTSEALRSIGVKEQKITWDTSKINKMFKDHKYLNDGIMLQIPYLLEKPIIVMQSKKNPNRIVMFGEVFDGDGVPVMAVLELLPKKDKTSDIILDEIKVVSTHSRKNKNPDRASDMTQTQNLINSSDILYIEPNKNRTDSWLMRTQLQLPFGITNYGSIKRVTYPGEKVKNFSEKNNLSKKKIAFEDIYRHILL